MPVAANVDHTVIVVCQDNGMGFVADRRWVQGVKHNSPEAPGFALLNLE